MSYWEDKICQGIIKVFLGISVLGASYGTYRGGKEILSGSEYSMQCVKLEEPEGFMTDVVFNSCDGGSSSMSYWSNFGSFSNNFEDLNNDGKVDIIRLDGRIYDRDNGPINLFRAADDIWRDYCSTMDCKGEIKSWKRWKDNQEQFLRYGNTIDSLVGQL